MKKTLIAIAAAATLAIATVAAPQQAEARYGRNGALIGGLAVGALLGAAIASQPYYYGGGPYYAAGPVYYGPAATGPVSGLDRLRLAPAPRARLRLTEA